MKLSRIQFCSDRIGEKSLMNFKIDWLKLDWAEIRSIGNVSIELNLQLPKLIRQVSISNFSFQWFSDVIMCGQNCIDKQTARQLNIFTWQIFTPGFLLSLWINLKCGQRTIFSQWMILSAGNGKYWLRSKVRSLSFFLLIYWISGSTIVVISPEHT